MVFEFPVKNKMAAELVSNVDDEIIFQKHVCNTYKGSVHDSKTGSMMPVMLQTEINGTKSKVSGLGLSHGNLMGGGDGSIHGKLISRVLNKKSVVGLKKKKTMEKQDSDIEIIDSMSGEEPHRVESKDKCHTVSVEKPKLEINTSVNSSDDDLDLDITDIQKDAQGKEKPPLAHSTKIQSAGQSRKIVIQRRQKEKVEPINLKVSKHTDSGNSLVENQVKVLE